MDLQQYLNESKNSKFNEAFIKLKEVVDKNIPSGYEWGFGYGMFGYDVPLTIYPQGYHVDSSIPLPFIGLAIQKHHLALYHMGLYMDDDLLDWFTSEYSKLDIGKLDIGKSCIRFRNQKKVPYDLIGQLISRLEINEYIKLYQQSHIL